MTNVNRLDKTKECLTSKQAVTGMAAARLTVIPTSSTISSLSWVDLKSCAL